MGMGREHIVEVHRAGYYTKPHWAGLTQVFDPAGEFVGYLTSGDDGRYPPPKIGGAHRTTIQDALWAATCREE